MEGERTHALSTRDFPSAPRMFRMCPPASCSRPSQSPPRCAVAPEHADGVWRAKPHNCTKTSRRDVFSGRRQGGSAAGQLSGGSCSARLH
jgi:hypothetical protein